MRVRFHTKLDEDLLDEFKIMAIKKKVNVNDLLEEAMKIYLKEDESNECNSKDVK